jgi:hypothetical protein
MKLALLHILLLGACNIVGIFARHKARRLGGGATLDYKRRESASDSRCMHMFSGSGARLPEWEVSGADTTAYVKIGNNRTGPQAKITIQSTLILLGGGASHHQAISNFHVPERTRRMIYYASLGTIHPRGRVSSRVPR